jgi:hypothetical protein
MEASTVAQEIQLFLATPVVSILALIALTAFIWKMVNWANDARIQGLEAQIKSREAQRDLALDRLQRSNEELQTVRNEIEAERIETARRVKITDERGAPREETLAWLGGTVPDPLATIKRVMEANSATASGLSHVRLADMPYAKATPLRPSKSGPAGGISITKSDSESN